ncbi:aminotransferase class V-fold PLP-dependent enzyme [Sphingomonas sp. NSE70-1]|uniref:Aminotransferase class V-fold PLP-dependent enzyme n=1 Tax=Sphingomonas caseinilyticus TaxID=2908205 RepID=A0ABT0RSM1_9SPHN|nr:aminotransferase class V-fold PLP-dependent enzyme [Sphingomonas caseinilyticus]MCL6698007.1 aminotransferase class V-fold PLP-dependent enzyme [Sphingomonas caseinilyticus]
MTAVENDPAGETYGPGIGRLDKVRGKAAGLLGCELDDIILTGSATAGMFLLAQGLAFRPGDRILTTDHEHPAGRMGWDWVARRYGVEVDTLAIAPGEADPAAIIDKFRAAIRPETRVLSFSHILFTTGVRLPAEELCQLAREQRCLAIVDGAQSAGAMPVDVREMGCHAYSASGHKWLMGPKGTGLLYLDPDIADQLDALPLQAGRRANSDSTGISNIAGLHGLGAAIDYVQALDPAAIEAHNMTLRQELYDALLELPGVTIPAPRHGPTTSANLSFRLPDGVDHYAIRRNLLMRHKVYLRVVDLAGFLGLRASLHCYNRSEDVAALIEALKAELAA